jgi:hypothetical protein
VKNVNWQQFRSDVYSSKLFTAPENTADGFADQMDAVVTRILDKHCPVQTRSKLTPTRRENRWMSQEAVDAKRQRRRLEREWLTSKRTESYTAYRKACRHANKAIIDSRSKYYQNQFVTTNADPRRRWTVIRDVLHWTEPPEVVSPTESLRLCGGFAEKINNIKASIKSSLVNKLCDLNPLQSDIKYTGKLLTDSQPPSSDEVSRLIRNMPAKSSVMDSIPTSVIKSSVDLFAPLIARLATLSFTEGTFPSRFKVASVATLMKKKAGLDRSVYANYRPISNLHTISKIIERITLSRITAHVESSPSYNRFQSAYRRGYSTETAITCLLNDVYLNADRKSRIVGPVGCFRHYRPKYIKISTRS